MHAEMPNMWFSLYFSHYSQKKVVISICSNSYLDVWFISGPPCGAKTKKVVRRPIKRTEETLTADITQIIRETV